MEIANSLLNHIACASLHRHCMKLARCSPSFPPSSMLEIFLYACSWLHTSTNLQRWSQGARGRTIPNSSILIPLPFRQKSCLNSPVNSTLHHVQWFAFNDERIHVLPCPNEAYKNDSKVLEATTHRGRLNKRIRHPSISTVVRKLFLVYENMSKILKTTVQCGRLSKHIRAPSISMVVRTWFLFHKNISNILETTVHSRCSGKHMRVPSISMVVGMWFLVATHHALPRCNVIDCKTPTNDRQDHYWRLSVPAQTILLHIIAQDSQFQVAPR